MASPVIGLTLAALSAAAIALPAGWFARSLVADHIQIPAVIEQQADLCAAATEAAAAAAVAGEQLRQFKIGERSSQRFIETSQAAADDARAKQDVLEMEIEHYAQRVRTRGGNVCALDADALELVGLHPN